MSNAERLLPQPEVIETLSNTSVLIPNPAKLEDESLSGILAESIFLTSKPVRIRARYLKYIDEINTQTIEKIRTESDSIDTLIFLLDKGMELGYADEVIIETFDK